MTDNPQEGNNTEPLVGAQDAEFDTAIQRLHKSIEKAQAAQATAQAALASPTGVSLSNCSFGGLNGGPNVGISPHWGNNLLTAAGPGFAATSTTTAVYTQPACGGTHVADDDATWIVGDTIHTTCMRCGQTLLLQEIPGGVSMLKVRALLGGALMLQEGCDEAILGEVLGIYAELLATIEREEEALDEQRRMLQLAGEMLQKKVAEGA